jgi:hypothetical protein
MPRPSQGIGENQNQDAGQQAGVGRRGPKDGPVVSSHEPDVGTDSVAVVANRRNLIYIQITRIQQYHTKTIQSFL